MAAERPESSLSTRGSELQASGTLIGKWKSILDDPYDAETNASGFINLGTSENVSKHRL